MIKKFENFKNKLTYLTDDENEGMIEGYLSNIFYDYFKEYDGVKYDIIGYSYDTLLDTGSPEQVFDGEDKKYFAQFMVKKAEIEIFELRLYYGSGSIELENIIHNNHYQDLVDQNFKIVSDFIYEKMKNDSLKFKK